MKMNSLIIPSLKSLVRENADLLERKGMITKMKLLPKGEEEHVKKRVLYLNECVPIAFSSSFKTNLYYLPDDDHFVSVYGAYNACSTLSEDDIRKEFTTDPRLGYSYLSNLLWRIEGVLKSEVKVSYFKDFLEGIQRILSPWDDY